MVTEAQAPPSLPSGQQLSTSASVEGGDIKLEDVPPLYTGVLSCPAPKVIPIFGSDQVALSNGSGSTQFSPIHLSNAASVQVRAL